jgi:hypothetical protein
VARSMETPLKRDPAHTLQSFPHLPGARWHRAGIFVAGLLFFAPSLPA